MTTDVEITIKRDDTNEVCTDADFFLYKLDKYGNEVSYTHYYMNDAKKIILKKNVDERYRIKLVNVPSIEAEKKKIQQPSDGVFVSFIVSLSSPQKVEVIITPKIYYHLTNLKISTSL